MFIRIPAFSFIAMLSLLAQAHANTIIQITDHGAVPNSGQDATEAFKQAIAAAKAAPPPVTLEIPAGRYDFDLASATVRNCHTSNSTESSAPQRHIALDLTDINGLTLNGPGATLMMRGQMTMLVAERCHGLTLRGLEFDFERPTFSEITAVEKGPDYWVGAVHPDSDYQILNGNSLLWIGPGMDTGYDQIQRYDPATRTVTRNNNGPIGAPSAITDIGGGRLRFTGGNLGNVVPGITYQFRRARRNEVGMWFNRCSNVAMEDVSVRAMHGFGILAQFTENVTYTRLTVAPKPGSGRTCASPADILHFSGCKGSVRVLDSTLTASHDDALNVHGTHLRIVAQPAPDQLRLRFMHHQSWGFEAFVAGDEIELVRQTTLLPYGNAVVESVQKVSDYEQLITLDRDVTGVNLNSDAVENVTWTPAVEMINCDLSQIPTRGILLTTRRPILIHGNRFYRTAMHGILIEDDASGWYESGPVHNLTVSGNSFYECAESVLQINPHYSGSHAGAVHKNILVKDNDFFLTGNGAAYAKSTDNLRFEGNRFRMRNNTTPVEGSLMGTSNTTGLVVSGNRVEPASAPALAVTDGGFEQPDVAPSATGTPTKWSVAGTAQVCGEGLADGAGASQFLSIDPGAAAFQSLGPYDPVQGSHLNWSLHQVRRGDTDQGSDAFELRFYAWDGVFDPAAGAPSASAMRMLGAPVPVTPLGARATRTVQGALDLTGIPAGTRVWLEIRATGTMPALLDAVAATSANGAVSMSFSSWIQAEGLAGADADPLADPDGDGLVNELEFALDGFDPAFPDSTPPLAVEPGGVLPAFRVVPRQGAAVELWPQYQAGTLLADGWSDVVDGVDGISLVDDSYGWLVSVTSLDHPAMFFRLRAAVPAEPEVLLAVTGGDFGTTNRNAQYVDGGGWFESTVSTNWVEGSWANPGSYPATFPAGSGMSCLFDGAAANGYIYQSLGTVTAGEIALGTLRITTDFAEKGDDVTVDCSFAVYSGSWAGAAHGADIAGAGLSQRFNRTLSAADQGLTAAAGNNSRATAVLVGDVDISGLSAGDEVWLRIGRPGSGTGDVIIDNVTVDAVAGS